MLAQKSIDAYTTVQKEALSGRELEASVLTRAANMLKQCQDNWDAQDRPQMLQEAIHFNQKVWSLFQAELSSPDNPLPKKLREDILSLSLFIDKQVFQIQAFPDPEKLTIIIDINRNIAAGLLTRPEAA
jgi:flagellar protein FlaF